MDRDPGWKLSPWMFVPIAGRLHAQRLNRSGASGIVILRQLFVSFVSSVLLFALAVVPTAVPEGQIGETTVSTWLLVVGLFGVVALVMGRWVAARELDGTSRERLAETYRKRFFLCIAISESVALLGFVGAFLAPGSAVYLAGGAIALAGFSFTAPTRARLVREDQRLLAAGSTLSIYDALG